MVRVRHIYGVFMLSKALKLILLLVRENQITDGCLEHSLILSTPQNIPEGRVVAIKLTFSPDV